MADRWRIFAFSLAVALLIIFSSLALFGYMVGENEKVVQPLAFGLVVVLLATALSLVFLMYFASENEGAVRTLAFGLVVVLLATVLSFALFAFFTPGRSEAAEPFGIHSFENVITPNAGEEPTRAGSHPYAMTTAFEFRTYEPPGKVAEEDGYHTGLSGVVKEVEVGLPMGVIVNPNTVPVKCAEAELDLKFECPSAAAIGVVTLTTENLAGGGPLTGGVYSLVPPPGVPAEIGFSAGGVDVHIAGKTRTGSDYGLSAKTSGVLEKGGIYSVALTLWGDPSSPAHNEERGRCGASSPVQKQKEREKWKLKLELDPSSPQAEEGYYRFNCPVSPTNVPLLTLPSSCAGSSLVATMSGNSWEEPERFVEAEAKSPMVTGCDKLSFEPRLSVRPYEPAEPATESPSGLEVNLKIPREESIEGLAQADLKEAVVTLPTGMTVSPSAANNLEACPMLKGREPEKEAKESNKELVGINLESKQPANCPAASKLGSVEVVTPLLEQPLRGSVYVAEQGDQPGHGSNPFESLLALYLVAEGSGAIVKLPGDVELNQTTGQVSASFGKDPATGFYLPQLPFSELKMRFFGGSRAPLVTPAVCGTYTTTSLLTPYGSEAEPLLEPVSPAAHPGSSFTVSEGCAHSFAPTLTAGTTNPQAGGFSNETVTIARNNGEQNLGGITVTTPPGLLGLLSKVPLCGEPQASQGTCGEESKIGEATVAVGPGEDPYWLKGGRVYLTGSYDHQPFGLSIVDPTTAGPFTLKGNEGFDKEVTRASIAVNPKTGALTITSEPLPTIIEGVPLDVRTIDVDINRSEFTFNPTNCEEMHVTSSITSTSGAIASPASRFEAANCAALPFKPSFSATTQGNSSDIGNGASLNVKVGQKAGEAAIRSVYLELPKKLPARLHTLQKACTEATFDANPANCPTASDVGKAIAHTPVLPVPLEGPGYFVSHGGAQYPELVFVLQGDGVTIDLAGETHINSKTKITSSTFGTVPDAPITSFEANLPEGPDSALAGITPKGVCGSASLSMPTTIVGQNGAQVKQTTKVAIAGCPKKKHKKSAKPKGKGKKSSSRRR
jgi:hypothetical protein